MKATAPSPRGETPDTWRASFSDAPLFDTSDRNATIAKRGNRLRLTVLSPTGRLSVSDEEQCEAIFDGWLYNRSELIPELAAPTKTTNAALIVRAYRRWGEAALDRLRGIFALSLWDARSQIFLAARDPLGVYPLFYARAGGEWLFSTSVDALLQHPRVPKAVNRTALAAYLLRNYRDIEETYFSSIRRVPPGHLLKLDKAGRGVRVARYWNPLPAEEISWVEENELEQFPVLMKGAIGRCFQFGRAGIYLSGGLDSGTVATLATEYAREKRLLLPHAVSLVYDDPEANEEGIQRGIAANLGIPQTLVRHEQLAEAGDIFSASLQLNRTWPHPLATGLSPIHLLLGGRAREEGCDFVLSGEGGDEWLDIHYRLAADLMRSLDLSRLLRLWRTSKETARDSWHGATKRMLGAYGLWPLLQDGLVSGLAKMAPGALRAQRRRSVEHHMPHWLAPAPELRDNLCARAEKPAREAPRTFYQREIMGTILNHPLTVIYKEDNFECSRRTGVFMLEPFYDPEVVQFLARTPPWLRCRGGRYKGLLRQFLHRRHPELGYDRQQKPYATGFVSRKVLEGVGQIWPILKGAQALSELGVVRAETTNALITESLETKDLGQFRCLWMTLCAEVWARSRM